MDVTAITVDKDEANRLYKAYLTHRHFETPLDAEIKRTYHALAKGGTVIKALESIVAAGPDADGMPKLAIIRADQRRAACQRTTNGGFSMWAPDVRNGRRPSTAAEVFFRFPEGSLPARNPTDNRWWREHEAVVPIVPIHLRPRRALGAYHILWEVEKWSPVHVARDPYLLRRLGKGDLWLVVAAWDLTEVERAALQSRVTVN